MVPCCFKIYHLKYSEHYFFSSIWSQFFYFLNVAHVTMRSFNFENLTFSIRTTCLFSICFYIFLLVGSSWPLLQAKHLTLFGRLLASCLNWDEATFSPQLGWVVDSTSTWGIRPERVLVGCGWWILGARHPGPMGPGGLLVQNTVKGSSHKCSESL